MRAAKAAASTTFDKINILGTLMPEAGDTRRDVSVVELTKAGTRFAMSLGRVADVTGTFAKQVDQFSVPSLIGSECGGLGFPVHGHVGLRCGVSSDVG